MRIGNDEFANFIRLDAELRALAGRYFEARAKTFNPRLRHEIEKIEFQDDGCTITYRSSHCSNCRGNDDVDEVYATLDDLLEFAEENEQDSTG